jgi:chromate transporter
MVERTRDDVKLTAPLTAITAAVVGVIVNLALFFAWRVFWPEAGGTAPFGGRLDVASVAIAMLATVALVSRRVEVIPVIAASGCAGLALWALGLQGAV